MERAWLPRQARLHVEESVGTDPRHRLILLHGFTQTCRSWDPFIEALGSDPSICRVDAPGHGRSPTTSESLFEVADTLVSSAGVGVYVGYSMGARISLHAAITSSSVRSLVLIGGTAGLEDAAERLARRESDRVLADRIASDGVDEFLQWWLAQPLFAGLRPTAEDLEERRLNTVEGLVSSLRHCGVGEQTPLWDRLPGIEVPVLVMVGDRDTKFQPIGRRMTDAIGDNASFVSIPDAGHAAHLENPRFVADAVRDWIG